MCGMPWVVRVMETVAGGSGDAEAAVANKDVINTSVRGQSGDIGHLGSEPAGNGRTDPATLGLSRDHRALVGDDGLPGSGWARFVSI